MAKFDVEVGFSRFYDSTHYVVEAETAEQAEYLAMEAFWDSLSPLTNIALAAPVCVDVLPEDTSDD